MSMAVAKVVQECAVVWRAILDIAVVETDIVFAVTQMQVWRVAMNS
jgi:hypothetical protein